MVIVTIISAVSINSQHIVFAIRVEVFMAYFITKVVQFHYTLPELQTPPPPPPATLHAFDEG